MLVGHRRTRSIVHLIWHREKLCHFCRLHFLSHLTPKIIADFEAGSVIHWRIFIQNGSFSSFVRIMPPYAKMCLVQCYIFGFLGNNQDIDYSSCHSSYHFIYKPMSTLLEKLFISFFFPL